MAFGEYRGPKSAPSFLRYARERRSAENKREAYRDYVTEHLRVLVGSDLSYREFVEESKAEDFDADQVVDDVITKMGLEVD